VKTAWQLLSIAALTRRPPGCDRMPTDWASTRPAEDGSRSRPPSNSMLSEFARSLVDRPASLASRAKRGRRLRDGCLCGSLHVTLKCFDGGIPLAAKPDQLDVVFVPEEPGDVPLPPWATAR